MKGIEGEGKGNGSSEKNKQTNKKKWKQGNPCPHVSLSDRT